MLLNFTVLSFFLLGLRIFSNNQWRREGGTPERPPPEIGKIVVEIWCYLSEVYTFGAESEIQEIFSKKLWKKAIFHRDFDQKISKFKILFIFGPNAQNFTGRSLNFTCPIEIIHQISMILHFSINCSRFSPKTSAIFMPFSIIFIYLSYSLSFFHKFLN